MSGWAARRFWKEARACAVAGGHGVQLDARPLMTPAKAPLIVPSATLAHAIAAEWAAQEGQVAPATMPLTRMANSALDKVAPAHAAVVDEIAGYGETDLLCHRAEGPAELVARQAAAWNPLLDWAQAALGARLVPVAGVICRGQPPESLARLRAQVAAVDAFALCALHDLVALSGSLVIGLRAMQQGADMADLWARARVDEAWQEEQWGRDDEAAAQAQAREAAFMAARRFLDLLEGRG